MGVQKEMTETGGFSSTQDTVLGLQAMTSYAALMTADNTNIDINIIGETATGAETTMGTATITEDDAMIVRVQNIDLTDDIASVKLESSGSGTIYTQLVLIITLVRMKSNPSKSRLNTPMTSLKDDQPTLNNQKIFVSKLLPSLLMAKPGQECP